MVENSVENLWISNLTYVPAYSLSFHIVSSFIYIFILALLHIRGMPGFRLGGNILRGRPRRGRGAEPLTPENFENLQRIS